MFDNLKPDTNITPMIYAYHKNPKSILAMLPKYEVPLTNDIIIVHFPARPPILIGLSITHPALFCQLTDLTDE